MNKNTIMYVILAILILGLLLLTLFPGIVNAIKDSGSNGNAIEDKCSPDPGYTEESWAEHMSHHPNIYAECFE